ARAVRRRRPRGAARRPDALGLRGHRASAKGRGPVAMNGAWRVLFALAVWLASVGAAHAGTRHALVVGTNEGLADEPVLEFAEGDARALAQTFVDSGAVDAGRVTTLLGRPLAELSSAFGQLGARVRPDDELWVFLSGHADQRGVHVRG